MVISDHDKFVFYLKKYIHWDQFNKLHDPDKIEKSIKCAYAIACKLRLASIQVTNNMLEVAREKK